MNDRSMGLAELRNRCRARPLTYAPALVHALEAEVERLTGESDNYRVALQELARLTSQQGVQLASARVEVERLTARVAELEEAGYARRSHVEALGEGVERLTTERNMCEQALSDSAVEVERLTEALAEEQTASLQQAEIARDALARIPDPDDLRRVLMAAEAWARAVNWLDTPGKAWHFDACARLRALLPKENDRG